MKRIVSRSVEIFRTGGLRMLVGDAICFLVQQPKIIKMIITIRQFIHHYYFNYSTLAPPFQKITVDPADIQYANKKINKYIHSGAIWAGDWDQNTVPYENSIKYRSVEQRYGDEIPWSKTDVYDYLTDQIDQTGRADGCYTTNQLKERFARIDSLYESIRTHGYDPSQSYSDEKRLATSFDQVCVSIGRNGELIFCGGGNHRLSIAKILGVESIPVRVVVRHRRWQQRREAISTIRRDDLELGFDLDHPDYKDIKENG